MHSSRVGKGKKVFTSLLTSLFVGANAGTVALLWACVLSSYANPADMPLLSLFGLAFPILLVANIAFFFFWLVFKVRMAWIPVVGILAVWGFVRDYCPVTFKEAPACDSAVCVLSYNVGQMKAGSYEALDSLVLSLRPDIVCIQEISDNAAAGQMFRRWQESMGYEVRRDASRVLVSRYPFVDDKVYVSGPTRGGNGTLMCRVLVDGDTVLVANTHMESNSLTVEDKQEYRRMIVEHHREQISHGGRLIAGKLCAAAEYRGQQTDSLAAIIDGHAGESVILCGDFNDTPVSYTFQTMARRLASAYTERGSGVGFSYNQGWFPVRIDHLFHSSDWVCVNCYVDKTTDASDHYPLVAYLCKKHP